MNIKQHIEAGHYPKDEKGRALVPMRNGKTAIIYLTDYDNPDFAVWQIVGRIAGRHEMEPRCWQVNGGFHGDTALGVCSPLDLLPPPPRKVEVKRWAIVRANDRSIVKIFDTEADAKSARNMYDDETRRPIVELTGSYEQEW